MTNNKQKKSDKKSRVRKGLIVALFTTLTLTQPVSSATASTKTENITIQAATKKINSAINSTIKEMKKGGVVFEHKEYYQGKLTESFSIKIDTKKNARYEDMVGTELWLGDNLYLTNNGKILKEFEKSIAKDLSLDINLNWIKVSLLEIDESVVSRDGVSILLRNAEPDYQIFSELPKGQKIKYKKNGTTETLQVSYKRSFDGFAVSNSVTKTVTITQGRLESIKEIYDKDDVVVSTWKKTKSLLIPPAGPFLEYAQIVNDPHYKDGYLLETAKNVMKKFLRDAQTLAAFAERSAPNSDDWASAIEGTTALQYEQAIEFQLKFKSEEATICAQIAEDGSSTIKLQPCSSLGLLRA